MVFVTGFDVSLKCSTHFHPLSVSVTVLGSSTPAVSTLTVALVCKRTTIGRNHLMAPVVAGIFEDTKVDGIFDKATWKAGA